MTLFQVIFAEVMTACLYIQIKSLSLKHNLEIFVKYSNCVGACCLFFVCYRKSLLASVCYCHTCCYDCQPSNDICYFFMCKAIYGFGMLPQAQDNSHLKEVHGSNLHPCNELVSDDHVHSCCFHLPKHYRYCKCIW